MSGTNSAGVRTMLVAVSPSPSPSPSTPGPSTPIPGKGLQLPKVDRWELTPTATPLTPTINICDEDSDDGLFMPPLLPLQPWPMIQDPAYDGSPTLSFGEAVWPQDMEPSLDDPADEGLWGDSQVAT